MDPWAIAGFGAWLAVSAAIAAFAGPWAGGLSAAVAVVCAVAFVAASALWPIVPPPPAVPVIGTAAWGGVVVTAGPATVVFVLPVNDPARWNDIREFPSGSVSGAFTTAISDGQRAAIGRADLGNLRVMQPGEATVFGPITVRGRERGWLVEWAEGKALIGDQLTVADLVDTEPDQVVGAVRLNADDMLAEIDRLQPLKRATIVLLDNLGKRLEAAYFWELGFPVRVEHALDP